MIVISSTNGLVGIGEAMRLLRAGGSAVDAVEAGIRLVEANPDDHSVGFGGYPNLLGQVELDAAIMDGGTSEAGAVGAMQGYQHPISVARRVMEQIPHVFLVGTGAERFAGEMGFQRRELLTEEALRVWEAGLQQLMPDQDAHRLAELPDLWRWVSIAADPERPLGTVNMIALDAGGNLCAGVSTSGWAWKYPGRLGDSAVIGAGLYADNRYGAAACTGMGEMALRACTARSVVLYLKLGFTLEEAGREAMQDLDSLGGRFLDHMGFLAMDRNGNHASFSSAAGRSYLYLTGEMDQAVQLPRIVTPIKQRWQSAHTAGPVETGLP